MYSSFLHGWNYDLVLFFLYDPLHALISNWISFVLMHGFHIIRVALCLYLPLDFDFQFFFNLFWTFLFTKCLLYSITNLNGEVGKQVISSTEYFSTTIPAIVSYNSNRYEYSWKSTLLFFDFFSCYIMSIRFLIITPYVPMICSTGTQKISKWFCTFFRDMYKHYFVPLISTLMWLHLLLLFATLVYLSNYLLRVAI